MLRAFVNRHCSNWICSSFPAVYLDVTDGMDGWKHLSDFDTTFLSLNILKWHVGFKIKNYQIQDGFSLIRLIAFFFFFYCLDNIPQQA